MPNKPILKFKKNIEYKGIRFDSDAIEKPVPGKDYMSRFAFVNYDDTDWFMPISPGLYFIIIERFILVVDINMEKIYVVYCIGDTYSTIRAL